MVMNDASSASAGAQDYLHDSVHNYFSLLFSGNAWACKSDMSAGLQTTLFIRCAARLMRTDGISSPCNPTPLFVGLCV